MSGSSRLAAGALFCLLSAGVAFATQYNTSSATLETQQIADGVYVVKGGVANTGFIVGEKEVLAVDAEMTADQAKQMIAEIKKVTSKPLTTIILTHSDGDHVNGLNGFPEGLEIISTVRAKEEMQQALSAPNAPPLQSYLPTRTFSDRMDFNLAPERIQLLHYGPAHTSGDLAVFLPGKKLVFVGDLVFIGRDPLIHRHKNGRSAGLIKTLRALLELDADRYIPGHGDIVTKAEIGNVLKNLEEKQAKVKSLIEEGKSLEEVKEAFGIADGPAKGGMGFPSLVENIYLELSENE
jgi:glyoxylase-like metal-dependent hydrolase (beta-lactamase superfamily II)